MNLFRRTSLNCTTVATFLCSCMQALCRLGHYRSTPFSGRAALDFWLLPSLLLTSDPSGRILWVVCRPVGKITNVSRYCKARWICLFCSLCYLALAMDRELPEASKGN